MDPGRATAMRLFFDEDRSLLEFFAAFSLTRSQQVREYQKRSISRLLVQRLVQHVLSQNCPSDRKSLR